MVHERLAIVGVGEWSFQSLLMYCLCLQSVKGSERRIELGHYAKTLADL